MSWGSTELWAVITTWRRRPGRWLTNRINHFGWNCLQLGNIGWHESFYTFSTSENIKLCELMVDDTMDGKNNKEKKIRGVADIRIYHFSWNFLWQGCARLWWWMMISIFHIFNMLTISRSWLLMVDDTGTIGWRRPWRLVKFWCVTSARMFFNEGGGVMSCFDDGYI